MKEVDLGEPTMERRNTLSQRFGSDHRGTDGVRVEKFKGFTSLEILEEIQKWMAELQCENEQFQGRIIFMSMYNDIEWGQKENQETVVANSFLVSDYARKFAHGHRSFLGLGSVPLLVWRIGLGNLQKFKGYGETRSA